MSVPWEILIKEYRKHIGTNNFDTLQEYQDDFIKFLKQNIHYVDKEEQENTLHSFIDFVLRKIIEDITRENVETIEKQKTLKGKKQIISDRLKYKVTEILNNHRSDKLLNDFK